MPNKTTNDQTAVLVAIKKLGSSLAVEIRKGDKLLRQEILKVEERVENLEEGQKRLEIKVGGLEVKVDRVEKGQESLSEKFDKLYNLVLEFLGRTETLEKENVIGTEYYRDHEKRISKLESSVRSA